MKKIFSLLLIALFALSFTACEEDESLLSTPSDEDMQPVSDNMDAEKGMMSATSYMNPYGLDEELSTKGLLNDGPAYTYNAITYVLTIDFTGVDGMGGTIVVDYDSNPLQVPLTSISATTQLNDFTDDGATYNGSLTFSMAVTVQDISMTVATVDGTSVTIDKGSTQSTWSGTRSMIWLEGINTPTDELDDVYQISGSATGVSSLATNYASEILTPLVLSPGCDYVMHGSQEVLNNVGLDTETSLTMTFHVDANGNELADPTCNSYFKLHFVSGLLDLTMIMDMDEF